MDTLVTSEEASRLACVKPSTFRAYVARGQAPKPRRSAGPVNLWSLTDLAAWRDLELSEQEKTAIRAVVARTYLRGAGWHDTTRRDLIQLGMNWRTAQGILDGIVLERIPEELYEDAKTVIDVRNQVRAMSRPDDPAILDGVPEERLIREAANDIADGADPFIRRGELALDLAARGYAEPMLPNRQDPAFWEAIDDAEKLTHYLLKADRMRLPEVIAQ